MTNQEYSLVQVETEDQWRTYHTIRSQVLFEGVYDPNHPYDREPHNHPVLLLVKDKAVGAMRIDLVQGEDYAILQTVAIQRAHQRHGYGKIMLAMAEDYALGYGCNSAVTISRKDAVIFYEKCGYESHDWDPSQQDEHGVQMRKLLTAI